MITFYIKYLFYGVPMISKQTNKAKIFFHLFIAGFFLLIPPKSLLAQSASQIQFFDSTGNSKTAKIGWVGSAAQGSFTVQTPETEILKASPTGVSINTALQSKNLTVDGNLTSSGKITTTQEITASSFQGDGSKLTNLSVTIPPNAIDSSKIANGSISGADINSSTNLTVQNATVKGNLEVDRVGKILSNYANPSSTEQDAPFRSLTAASTLTNFNGPVPAEIFPLISGPDKHGGFGMYHGSNVVSPFVYMYDNPLNAFTVRKRGFNLDLNTSQNLFTVYSSGDVWTKGKLDVNGEIKSNGSVVTSDKRYKTQIQTLTQSLDKILALNGVSYYWDKEKWPEKQFPETKQIGLIAQDVELIVPEIVSTDKNGYKAIAYDKLGPLLINAVQELKGQIDSLKIQNSTYHSLLSKTESALEKAHQQLEAQQLLIENLYNKLSQGK